MSWVGGGGIASLRGSDGVCVALLCYPRSGAVHAHWCVVFAQLFVGGANQGIHGFLVRIRNPDLTICPGVRIEDMGHKMGCNGVDNGKLWFDHVR